MRTLSLLLLSLPFLAFIGGQRDTTLPKDLRSDWARIAPTSETSQAYYIGRGEVTNAAFRAFLQDLAQTDSGLAKRFHPEEKLWSEVHSVTYGEPYRAHYFKHPAFDPYPVVNISREAAEHYCEWLQNQWAATYPEFRVQVGLPTHAEWLHATGDSNRYTPYAWGGPYLRNARGEWLANFRIIGSESITYNAETDRYEVVPQAEAQLPGRLTSDAGICAPVMSYPANHYGVHHLNGNVAEMLADKDLVAGGSWNSPGYDIRNKSVAPYIGPHPTVGFRVVLRIEPTP